jgi:NAD+ synthase
LLRVDSDLSGVKKKITSFIKEKVEQSQTDGVVFELHGDVNSAVTAYLCIEALGTRRVTGLIMPDLRLSVDEDIADAREVADELCLETREFDIAPIHKAFMKNLEGDRLAEDNLRARIRMSLLYYHANLLNRLVTGTGDRSEFLLGYFTKHGNGGVDILPIADLYRSEVRKLGEVLGINRRLVAKKGSRRPRTGQVAGTKSDLDYDTTDQIFKLRLDDGLDVQVVASRTGVSRAKVDGIISRYESSMHKRATPEICSLR